MGCLKIAGYCRISVDEEMDRENTSIENQKSIIDDFVKRKFPDAELDFYEDRDKSGYTFDQREGYKKMRPKLMDKSYEILIIKDFSRFSRRNSKGLVELEDLRDAGVRIIAIGDSIDYPTYDDWTAIQFRFLINEMPVTDTSKKVKSVIKRRQSEGKWICAVPYGYEIINAKNMTIKVDEPAAEVVRKIFELYNDGYGYKKIANYLTDLNIPTPRMAEKSKKDAKGEENKIKAKHDWSIVTVQGILENDFYIGTLRQGKYMRKKINGGDVKVDEAEHIIFENHHEPIIDYRTFATAKEQLKKRTTSNYRGIKKYDNVYSGFLFCGDCGSPMFSMSRKDLAPAYTCGTYHNRGTKGCSSHHTRVDLLDTLLKSYIKKVKDNSTDMIEKLNISLANEKDEANDTTKTIAVIENQIEDAKLEIKALVHQKAREIMRNPEKEEFYDEMYSETIDELADKTEGLKNQMEMILNKHNTIITVNRVAKTAIEVFDDIINKPKLSRADLELIIDKIVVYNDRIEINLKADIDNILKADKETELNFNQGTKDTKNAENFIFSSKNRKDKILSVNVISKGDPLEIYTSADGEVIFKKYSAIGEMANNASQVADIVGKLSGCPVVVFDRDHVIAVSGVQKKEFNERRVSQGLEDMLEHRKVYLFKAGETKLSPVEGIDKNAIACAPILSSGDVTGAVAFLSPTADAVATENHQNLIMAAAQFLGKQVED